MNDKEAAIERQQVEEVFGLTGGELETDPWVYWTQQESEVYGTPLWDKDHRLHADSMVEWQERYWYEGVPDYDQDQDYGRSYRTLVNPGGMIMGPHQELYDGDGIWRLVTTYSSSGEAPCPAQSWGPINREDHQGRGVRKVTQEEADLGFGEKCPLCDEEVGDDHGYIYFGVCSYEAVYVLEEQHRWQVVVGNIGTVYDGQDEGLARSRYLDYVGQSRSGVGRAAGEDVTLMVSSPHGMDIDNEYTGTNHDRDDDGGDCEPTGEWPEGSGG